MIELVNFPICEEVLADYQDLEDLKKSCLALGLDGIESVWGGEMELEFSAPFSPGYHLTFFPDWLDFWREDEAALLKKFGSKRAYTEFYRGEGKEHIIDLYRADLERALRAGAQYVVMHVSDVSIQEGYTYEWLHSDWEVLDASIELINLLFGEKNYPFALLLENQWWPGFTFTDAEKTAYLLNRVEYKNKGIMLDTGHLMNANTSLRSQADGIRYIHEMLDLHGDLTKYIKGLHLHQSLSGKYVEKVTREHAGKILQAPADYVVRYGENYSHVLQIDQHKPWTDPAIASVIRRIGPDFVTHELSSSSRAERERLVALQRKTLNKGLDDIRHGFDLIFPQRLKSI